MTAGDMSDNADVSLELTPSAAQVRSEDPVESLADVTEEQQAEAEAFAGLYDLECLLVTGGGRYGGRGRRLRVSPLSG